MAQFTIYSSTDTGAPTLTGEIGSLVNLLGKCLVTGYGAKAAAGWTKPWTGTNKAAFTQGAGSCGFTLRVQDDAGGTGLGRDALCTGYTSMSSVDAGDGQFPNAAVGLGGVSAFWVFRKSDTVDTVQRTWLLFADSRTFYLLVTTSVSALATLAGFGDFFSLAPGTTDAYRCFLAGYTANSINATVTANSTLQNTAAGGTWAATSAYTVAKGLGGIGGGVSHVLLGDTSRGAASGATSGILQTPNGPDSGYYLSPLWVANPSGFQLRGRFRGMWHWLHPGTAVNHGDSFSGTGPQAGKTFLLLRAGATNTILVIETSDTLETNA